MSIYTFLMQNLSGNKDMQVFFYLKTTIFWDNGVFVR